MDHAARSPGCPSVQQPAGGEVWCKGGGEGGQAREGMGERRERAEPINMDSVK